MQFKFRILTLINELAVHILLCIMCIFGHRGVHERKFIFIFKVVLQDKVGMSGAGMNNSMKCIMDWYAIIIASRSKQTTLYVHVDLKGSFYSMC